MILATCGTVWLSVRGQHPYRGPTAAAIVVVCAFVVLHSGVTFAVARRATSGVSGRSRLSRLRLRPWPTRSARRRRPSYAIPCRSTLAVACVSSYPTP